MFQLSTICKRGFGTKIMFFTYGFTTFIGKKFIDSCSLGLRQMAAKLYRSQSGTRPTRPYPPCSCHTRPAEDIRRFLPPSPVPLQFKKCATPVKFRFAGTGNGNQKLNLSSFREPLTARPRKSSKSTFVPGTNFLYQTEPSLVHFLYR